MIALVLAVALAQTNYDALTQPAPPEEVKAEAVISEEPLVDARLWAGEQKRVHLIVGQRLNGGAMMQQNVPAILVQGGLLIGLNVRTFGHQEASVSFVLSGSLVDTVLGETLVSYRFHLTPRFSVGAGLVFLWGFWSFRGGVEIPFAIRIDEKRKHELGLTLRGTAGGYNNSTFVWWDFAKHKPAGTIEGALTYTFVF